MKIALGADHRGYNAKTMVKAFLGEMGHDVLDFGTNSNKPFDYPDAAFPTATAVRNGECDLGVLFCGTGNGMCIAANKVKGVRAALCHDELTTEMARRHNNANILCLPADLVGEALMRRMIEVWLKTPYEGGRHDRRVEKIAEIEAKERTAPGSPEAGR